MTLEAQLKEADEENKLLTAEVKSLSAGLLSTEPLPLACDKRLTLFRTGEDQVYPYRLRTRRTGCTDGRKGAGALAPLTTPFYSSIN